MSDDLPYGVDTIVIPFTWVNRPPARQLPWMRFGGRRVAPTYTRAAFSQPALAEPRQEPPESRNAPHPDIVTENVHPVTDVVTAAERFAAVPALEDDGAEILDESGLPILRPEILNPNMFVTAGLNDRQRLKISMASPGGTVPVPSYLTARLQQFARGGPWDAQRLADGFDNRLV